MLYNKVQQAVTLLQSIVDDTGVPKNIRAAANNAIKMLQSEKLSLGVRAANAISILEDISQDPNMPLHTRVRLWSIISILETIKD
ncbi:MAG: UPF0147 family protein [Candidatus Methanomethylicia archaeon]